MSDKITRLGIERDNDLMYYIKNGDVWATPRKQKGQPKGKAQKVAAAGLEMDYSKYIYYLDGDGDVARKERHLGGGGKRAKTTSAKTSAKTPPKTSAKTTAPAGGGAGGKSPAQLEREIKECLAQAKKPNGNGAAPASKRGGKKKKTRR
jgi:hypothetical protein